MTEVCGGVTSLDKQRVNICHFLSSPSVKLISEIHSRLGLFPHLRLCTSTGWRRGVGWGMWRRRTGTGLGGVEEEGHWAVKKVRLLLLPLVSRFRLLPLNHAATHNAVKTPQVEEGDGPK